MSLGAALSLPLLIYSGRIFISIGAGPAAAMATAYARIMFSGITAVFLANVGNSTLRAEADAKRAMRAMVLGSVLNIVLDPVFIYPPGWGSGRCVGKHPLHVDKCLRPYVVAIDPGRHVLQFGLRTSGSAETWWVTS